VMEDDMPGRVARAMDHVEGLFAEADRIAVVEPAIRLEGIEPGETEALALFGQLPDPEGILALGTLDRHAMAARELGRLSAVVDVAMGEQDLLDARAQLPEGRIDPVEVAAGI